MKILREVTDDGADAAGRSELLHHEENVRVARFHLDAGAVVEPHRSDSTVLLHVIRGAGTFRSGDHEALLTEGESALFAPGQVHAVEAGGVPVTFLAVLAPGPR
jgi:quercetin dioxygenase-like cupin family protein